MRSGSAYISQLKGHTIPASEVLLFPQFGFHKGFAQLRPIVLSEYSPFSEGLCSPVNRNIVLLRDDCNRFVVAVLERDEFQSRTLIFFATDLTQAFNRMHSTPAASNNDDAIRTSPLVG